MLLIPHSCNKLVRSVRNDRKMAKNKGLRSFPISQVLEFCDGKTPGILAGLSNLGS